MPLPDFDYHLPRELIAQEPARPRDAARLMVVNRSTGEITHRIFRELPDLLDPSDVLVFNDSKVIPARLIGRKQGTGGQVEVFLLNQLKHSRTRQRLAPTATAATAADGARWAVLVGGRVNGQQQVIEFGPSFFCTLKRLSDGRSWEAIFNQTGPKFWRSVEKYGQVPLPPYIKADQSDPAKRRTLWQEYQTVYANEAGSVASPTAGLHFTDRLLKTFSQHGLQQERITLHVGLGTFAPITEADIAAKRLHQEWAEISQPVARRLSQAKRHGREIVAVGTTTLRTLETFQRHGEPIRHSGWISTFIQPGYQFQVVDKLITNFHLPKSSLLMLVAAFGGYELIMEAYRVAAAEKYRFYSFGDAMAVM